MRLQANNLASSISNFSSLSTLLKRNNTPYSHPQKIVPQMVFTNPNDETCNPIIIYQFPPVIKSSSFNKSSDPASMPLMTDSLRNSNNPKCSTFHIRTPTYYTNPPATSKPKSRKKRKRIEDEKLDI